MVRTPIHTWIVISTSKKNRCCDYQYHDMVRTASTRSNSILIECPTIAFALHFIIQTKFQEVDERETSSLSLLGTFRGERVHTLLGVSRSGRMWWYGLFTLIGICLFVNICLQCFPCHFQVSILEHRSPFLQRKNDDTTLGKNDKKNPF